MGGAEDEWVQAAMSDDTVVAEFLLRLCRTSTPPPPPPPPLNPVGFPLKWGVRQRRSKSIALKKKPARRASPTTPLSWSGGGSDGSRVDCNQPLPVVKLSKTTRSKVNRDVEKTASRKNKTWAELKEEEKLLINERRELKREIATLRENMEEQRATNEILKRTKIESRPHRDRETNSRLWVSNSRQFQTKITAGHPIHFSVPSVISSHDITRRLSLSNGHPKPSRASASDPRFVLPDLNIAFNHSKFPANLY